MQTLQFDVQAVRAQFPILSTRVHNKPLVYLDNANTTQKPQVVIDRTTEFYETENANLHRATHFLSEVATRRYEEARVKVSRFVNSPNPHQIIFTRGCTEGINLVAATWGRQNIEAGDEILLSEMEHHSNIVPWQMVAKEKGAKIVVAPVNERGELLVEEWQALLSPRTKFASIIHVSNALGTINPVKELVGMAHANGTTILVDGAQSVPHARVDLQEMDADFFTFSSHKIYGPTGIGALYGKAELLESMPPYQFGGDMISSVSWGETTWNEVPYKFEAGTPNMAGATGFGTAIDWVNEVGIENIAAHEAELLSYATERIREVGGVRIIGEAAHKASVLSFVMDGAHPNDIGHLVDTQGVAIRTGHHCAEPLMRRFGVPATCRASFAAYNTREDVDAFISALEFARELLV